MNNTVEQDTKAPEMEEKVTQNKKSDLLADQKILSALSEKLLKEMQEREYSVDLKNKKIYDGLVKFLEKDAPWGHTTATGLIMLYHNLREQKDFTRDKDWDGKIMLRAANVTIMWSMVTKMTGKGFFEARDFVELMAVCGESLSQAVQAAHADNAQLRETHHKLSMIDDQLASGNYINDVEDEVAVEQSSLVNEVDPVVEL
jgi:hypothetical protein